MAFDPASGAAERIKVFVSYSRADTPFALDLVAGLQACGFEAFIDQEDIAPGEPWEQRLGGLIESADTVVYVLSPDSLASEHCSWEVNETLRLNKRLLPVVWRAVGDDGVPQTLSKLNYTFFSGQNTFARGLRDLSEALRVDHGWVREHTRIGALARRWQARGRGEALLLRGEELEAASAWAAARPHGAPELSDDQVDFIAASKTAHDAAERAARNRRRGLLIAVSTIALAMAGLASFAAMQWRQAAEARDFAREAYTTLEQANSELAAALIRLSADLSLRAPPTGRRPFSVQGGWFPVAATYSGAVVRLERRHTETRQIVTGVLVAGEMIHPDWTGDTLLLSPPFQSEADILAESQRLTEFLEATDAAGADGAAAFEGERFSRAGVFAIDSSGEAPAGAPDIIEQRYVDRRPDGLQDGESVNIMEQRAGIADDDLAGAGEDTLSVSFPTLRQAAALDIADTPLWRTPIELAGEPVFVLYRLDDAPPFGARPLGPGDLDCATRKVRSEAGERYAVFGIDATASGAGDDEALTLLVTDGLDLIDSGAITYRHATLLGAFGAPVFDLDSGKVIAIHQGVDSNRSGPGGRVGFAEPLLPVIDLIRDDVSIDRGDAERTPPLCDVAR